MSATESLPTRETGQYVYAGFWRRVPAYLLDGLLIILAAMALDTAYLIVTGQPLSTAYPVTETPDRISVSYHPTDFGFFMEIAISIAYFAFFESSKYRATPGKLAMGLVVVDEQGRRLSLQRALLRAIGKLASLTLFFLGFLMAGWTARKQALHDFFVESLVMKRIEKPIQADMQLAEG